MRARTWCAIVAPLMLACSELPAGAQQLAQRVASAAGSRVQFTFATREGVCGDGHTYIHSASAGNSSLYGSFNDITADPCVRGPARVVLDRAGGTVVGLRVFVGPPSTDGATDLGAVSARDAVGYLMHLASTAEGAVARDAIMPAMLADSVDNNSALVAMARDKALAREVRRSALSWLGRDEQAPIALVQTLLDIGNDETDNQSVREQALSTLARLDGGAGIPALTNLANDTQGGWVARTALAVIARSGDPRAHDYLRGVIQKAALPDEVLSIAIRGFGQQFSTPADIKFIRDTWPKFTGESARNAAISVVAEFGGSDNTAWLLSLARDSNASVNIRRRAVSALAQSSDPRVKDALAGIVVGR